MSKEMSLPPVSISSPATPYSVEHEAQRKKALFGRIVERLAGIPRAIQRRRRRKQRRRHVGRAYDMALEIARVVPRRSRVLDVGCGLGFVAHHLTAMLGKPVVGIDVPNGHNGPEAEIDYLSFDGTRVPVLDQSFDAVLLCYVLHHTQDLSGILNETRRVLCQGAQAIVYEDVPRGPWDHFFCWTHAIKWRSRTGRCTFRQESEWRSLFESFGFEIVTERPLSRWRNLRHPVCRRFFVLKLNNANGKCSLASPRDH